MSSKKAALITAAAVALAGVTGTAALAIVGGSTVRQAPSWMGSLQLAGGQHECGAALVAPTWAVTAKHCLQVNLAQARFGSLDYRAGGELVRIAATVPGPKAADIALIQLATPVAGAPVGVAATSPAPGSGITLLGWGQTSAQPGSSDAARFLKQLQTQVLADSSCRQASIDGPNELCIQSTPQQTACYGDSGGPAIVDGALVGATSRGSQSCGDANTVYNDVTVFRSWIVQTTGATGGPGTGGQGNGGTPPTTAPVTDPGNGSGPGAAPLPTAPMPTAPSPTGTATGPAGTGLTGAHIQGNWRLRTTPTGKSAGVLRNGSVVTVDCQAVGPQLSVSGLGSSRIWDHIPGRGFVSDLAVAETPYQQRDPRIPTCASTAQVSGTPVR